MVCRVAPYRVLYRVVYYRDLSCRDIAPCHGIVGRMIVSWIVVQCDAMTRVVVQLCTMACVAV